MTGKAIAIDGPAGAGKSTIAKLVAKKLGYLYIDTGAMYRAVAWKALQAGVAFEDERGLGRLAQECELVLKDEESGYKVFCDGVDISEAIRTPQVGAAASPVSAVGEVRTSLVAQQRRMASQYDVVMDGRDIGTKVLPDAACKVFLTASLAERARRRTEDLSQKGHDVNFEEVKRDIEERDARDSSRSNSPLVQAEDGILLDSTNLTIEQVVAEILTLAKEEKG